MLWACANCIKKMELAADITVVCEALFEVSILTS